MKGEIKCFISILIYLKGVSLNNEWVKRIDKRYLKYLSQSHIPIFRILK